MNLKEDNYKIFYNEVGYLLEDLVDQIIDPCLDKEYKVLNVYKDDKRSYISKISFRNKNYILKFPKNESNIPQRKIMTMLKKGEALNTFIRTNYYKKKGLNFLPDIYVVGVKRKKFLIEDSFIIMEAIEGKETQPSRADDVNKIKAALKLLHSYGLKHGDANPRNFIIEKKTGDIKVIDTQLKKDFFGIGRNYDYINLYYSEVKSALEGTVNKKSLSYLIAAGLKGFKRLKVVAFIKKIKKNLRNKGWKI